MKQKNIEMVKTIVGAVISIGVGTVVGNILHTTTPKDAGKIGKALSYIGGACIEGLVVAHAQDEADQRIDGFVEEVKNAMVENEEEEVKDEQN